MQLHMKPRVTASHLGHENVCDEVGSGTYVRTEGSRGKKKRENNFYAIINCYHESIVIKRLLNNKLLNCTAFH